MKETFYEQCYQKIKQVPRGKVTTYKAVAKALGTKAYRAVGTAMRKNPSAPLVPCHRVINSDGTVGKYARGKKKKRELLIKEGILIKKGTIDLNKYQYRFL